MKAFSFITLISLACASESNVVFVADNKTEGLFGRIFSGAKHHTTTHLNLRAAPRVVSANKHSLGAEALVKLQEFVQTHEKVPVNHLVVNNPHKQSNENEQTAFEYERTAFEKEAMQRIAAFKKDPSNLSKLNVVSKRSARKIESEQTAWEEAKAIADKVDSERTAFEVPVDDIKAIVDKVDSERTAFEEAKAIADKVDSERTAFEAPKAIADKVDSERTAFELPGDNFKAIVERTAFELPGDNIKAIVERTAFEEAKAIVDKVDSERTAFEEAKAIVDKVDYERTAFELPGDNLKAIVERTAFDNIKAKVERTAFGESGKLSVVRAARSMDDEDLSNRMIKALHAYKQSHEPIPVGQMVANGPRRI